MHFHISKHEDEFNGRYDGTGSYNIHHNDKHVYTLRRVGTAAKHHYLLLSSDLSTVYWTAAPFAIQDGYNIYQGQGQTVVDTVKSASLMDWKYKTSYGKKLKWKQPTKVAHTLQLVAVDETGQEVVRVEPGSGKFSETGMITIQDTESEEFLLLVALVLETGLVEALSAHSRGFGGYGA
jgi:hypothetical protein